MRTPSAETKSRILTTAYNLFYQKGFARVSVDAIAAAAGVTKRTLYNHFDSKDRLVAAMLEFQQILALRQIEEWAGGARNGNAETMVDELFERFKLWASRPRWSSAGYTRIAMELADLPGHPARDAVRRHKKAVESVLEAQLAACHVVNPGEVARQLALLIEGCNVLVLIHGDPSYADLAAAAGRSLVRAGMPSAGAVRVACSAAPVS
jgi:AcrR family transcriptional regulator